MRDEGSTTFLLKKYSYILTKMKQKNLNINLQNYRDATINIKIKICPTNYKSTYCHMSYLKQPGYSLEVPT